MRGSSLLTRFGIAAVAAAFLATQASAQLAWNTGGSLWNQINFSANSTSFSPGQPTTLASTFNYTNSSWSTATAAKPATFDAHLGYQSKYNAPGFDVNQSWWVGTHPSSTGGWSIFYYDFDVTGTSPVAASGKFSSDNSSYLFLDNFGLTGMTQNWGGSQTGSGTGSFSINSLTAGLLNYHTAADPDPSNDQMSYNLTSNFSFTANVGQHRLWALVRNDVVNAPNDNPLGFRLQFNPGDGGGNTTPVPEPFTMALGAAGIGLAVRRRLKKSS